MVKNLSFAAWNVFPSFPHKFTTEGGPTLRTTSLVATVSKVSEDAYIFFRAFE